MVAIAAQVLFRKAPGIGGVRRVVVSLSGFVTSFCHLLGAQEGLATGAGAGPRPGPL
jgi:hypothetical protein